jgi:hypothetical protein
MVIGIGFAGRGAVLVRNGVNGTLSGNLNIIGDTSIDVEQNTFSLNGAIQDVGGSFNLTKLGVGTLNSFGADVSAGGRAQAPRGCLEQARRGGVRPRSRTRCVGNAVA